MSYIAKMESDFPGSRQGDKFMWVYQESSNQALIAPKNQNQSAAAQQVDPAAPIDAKERVSFGSSKPSEKSSTGGRGRTIPRDCIFLSISYLFGALLAGVTLALCRANELDTLSAYLSNWAGLFALDDPKSVWNLFGAEYMTTAGGATVLLLLGLSAFGPVLIHLFAMLFGLGIGMVQLQLFLQAGWKSSLQALCLTGIPTAAVVTCLCLFGASALRVSGRLQNTAFGKKAYSSGSGARRLVGQYLVLNVLFLPICGISTALVCLAHQLSSQLAG